MPRRPAEVTAELRARIAEDLAPLGFTSTARAYVRKRGTVRHEIGVQSSHYNSPAEVRWQLVFAYVDRRVGAIAPDWRAFGRLASSPLVEPEPGNLVEPAQAARLCEVVRANVAYFDLLDDAARAFAEVCRRYVPGFVEPAMVVPYLVARIGVEAADAYARALLAARPELGPAFASARAGGMKKGPAQPDHGTQLARALAAHGAGAGVATPDDVARSERLEAASYRSHVGLSLRAWGEPEAAASLRRLDDAAMAALQKRQAAVKDAAPVDSVEAATLAIEAATGTRRPPRRAKPEPRLAQYAELMAPFGG
jgi:hypothetical protein